MAMTKIMNFGLKGSIRGYRSPFLDAPCDQHEARNIRRAAESGNLEDVAFEFRGKPRRGTNMNCGYNSHGHHACKRKEDWNEGKTLKHSGAS